MPRRLAPVLMGTLICCAASVTSAQEERAPEIRLTPLRLEVRTSTIDVGDEVDTSAAWVESAPDAPLTWRAGETGAWPLWEHEGALVAEPVVTRSREQTAITAWSADRILTVFFDEGGRPVESRATSWHLENRPLTAQDSVLYHFGQDMQVVMLQNCPDPQHPCEALTQFYWIGTNGHAEGRQMPWAFHTRLLNVDAEGIYVVAGAGGWSEDWVYHATLNDTRNPEIVFQGYSDPLGIGAVGEERSIYVQSVRLEGDEQTITVPLPGNDSGNLCWGVLKTGYPDEGGLPWVPLREGQLMMIESALVPDITDTQLLVFDPESLEFNKMQVVAQTGRDTEPPLIVPFPTHWPPIPAPEWGTYRWQPVGTSSWWVIGYAWDPGQWDFDLSASSWRPGQWDLTVFDASGIEHGASTHGPHWRWLLHVDPRGTPGT